MSLHTHKARSRPGAADMACIALVGVVVACLTVVALTDPGPQWTSVRGSVESARVYTPASTALAASQLVQVEYRYTVDGYSYRGMWEGDWPRSYSPNALAGAALAAVTERGYPLFVFYDPEEPARSKLHGDGGWGDVIWRRLVAGAAVVLWFWSLRLYPQIKNKWRVRNA